MSLHSFHPDIAQAVGVNAAVIYQNILFWTQKNLANGRNVSDEYVWTYNSVKAWAELFPYLSTDQVRRALAKLVSAGLIREGNHNQSAYDRTKWYGVSTQIHLAKTTNGFGENHEPIPDSKPDHKPDNKLIAHSEHDQFDEFWREAPRKVGKGQARKAWKAALKKADADTIIAGMRRFAGERRGQDPQYTAHPSTWLNGERWLDEATARPHELHDKLENQLKGTINGLSITDAYADRADERVSAQLSAPTSSDGRSGIGRDQEHCGGSERPLRSLIKPRRFP